MANEGNVYIESDLKSLSLGGQRWLNEHFQLLESKIVNEAKSQAKDDGREVIEPKDISNAALMFAPGYLLQTDVSFWTRIFPSISGITLVAGFLAVIFGIIGAVTNQPGYFDIVKVFVGAVLGSTGASISSSRQS
jgi:hypothetical protein